MAQLVYHLFQFTHGMWIHRSNVVHERDTAGMELKERTILKAEMKREYVLGKEDLD